MKYKLEQSMSNLVNSDWNFSNYSENIPIANNLASNNKIIIFIPREVIQNFDKYPSYRYTYKKSDKKT